MSVREFETFREALAFTVTELVDECTDPGRGLKQRIALEATKDFQNCIRAWLNGHLEAERGHRFEAAAMIEALLEEV